MIALMDLRRARSKGLGTLPYFAVLLQKFGQVKLDITLFRFNKD